MVNKRVLRPERVRVVPSRFSRLDHRLVRERHVDRCSTEALALYLFLVTVADAKGLSYYGDASVCASRPAGATARRGTPELSVSTPPPMPASLLRRLRRVQLVHRPPHWRPRSCRRCCRLPCRLSVAAFGSVPGTTACGSLRTAARSIAAAAPTRRVHRRRPPLRSYRTISRPRPPGASSGFTPDASLMPFPPASVVACNGGNFLIVSDLRTEWFHALTRLLGRNAAAAASCTAPQPRGPHKEPPTCPTDRNPPSPSACAPPSPATSATIFTMTSSTVSHCESTRADRAPPS